MPDDMTDEDLSDLEHHRRGMADIVAHGSVPWEQVKLGPLATHTITTQHSLPREGEGADLPRLRLQAKIAEQGRDLSRARKLYRRLKEELAAADKIERLLNGKIDDHRQTIASLRAELAKRDEAIGDAFGEDASDEEEAFVQALPNVAEVVAEHDAELNGALGRLVAHADKATIATLRTQLAAMTAERDAYASAALAGLSAFGCTPMEGYVKDGGVSLLKADFKRARERFKSMKHENASLRAQLARAGAIEKAVREVDRIRWKFDDNIDSWALKHAIDRLATTLAAPSPGPRGTAEGEPAAKAAEVDFPPPGPGTIYYPANGSPAPESLWAVVTTEDKVSKARLAILERVLKEARAVGDWAGAHNVDRLRLALADLDATEVES